MSDNNGKAAPPQRGGSAAADDYELRHFAEEHGLTTEEVLDLVARRVISVRFPISSHKS